MTTNSGKTARILVVEDEVLIRESIMDMLEMNDFIPVPAKNGSVAMEIIRSEKPDLILSDLMMPVMDGFELIRQVRANRETELIPFIMITAKVDLESKLEGLELGVDDYITKPFEFRELLLKITNFLTARDKLLQRNLVQPDGPGFYSSESVLLNKLRLTLEEHLEHENISIDFLCKQLYMSPATLNRRIRNLTGKSPGQIVKEFKLKKARNMILMNFGSLSEIAVKSGFNSLSYFSSAYKEFYGCSPNEDFQKD